MNRHGGLDYWAGSGRFHIPGFMAEISPATQFTDAVDSLLVATAGAASFLDGFLDCFTGFTCALLNPAHKFFLLAFGELEIVVRELGPLLFQLALGDVPVAFDFKCVHCS
jgi:hypothetical protein